MLEAVARFSDVAAVYVGARFADDAGLFMAVPHMAHQVLPDTLHGRLVQLKRDLQGMRQGLMSTSGTHVHGTLLRAAVAHILGSKGGKGLVWLVLQTKACTGCLCMGAAACSPPVFGLTGSTA